MIFLLQALVEILLLSGGTPYANFKDLAYAWGREKGFHHLLATSVCERRGEVERKKRSDAGRTMTTEERQLFREKLKRSRGKGGSEIDDDSDDNHMLKDPNMAHIADDDDDEDIDDSNGDEGNHHPNVVDAHTSVCI
jgi:hypothetical protein